MRGRDVRNVCAQGGCEERGARRGSGDEEGCKRGGCERRGVQEERGGM